MHYTYNDTESMQYLIMARPITIQVVPSVTAVAGHCSNWY